ncbi:MAG: DUF1987 domain-containing protein [Bacteroidota bacterium]|nr:DUF1987 domain-containing protein [Bacteroidota bacterium]
MVKKEIHILPTLNTPEVILSPKGVIKIKGRALSLNNKEFPEQILNGFNTYLNNPPDITDVIIAFEYLNSFSTRILVSFLEKLSKTIQPPKKLSIRWYYEEDDDDMLELGQYISEIYHLPIHLMVTDDITGI